MIPTHFRQLQLFVQKQSENSNVCKNILWRTGMQVNPKPRQQSAQSFYVHRSDVST